MASKVFTIILTHPHVHGAYIIMFLNSNRLLSQSNLGAEV
jgi:hypothetical protein